MDDERRTQPEFSPGERLATLEATQAALDRRFTEINALFDQKLLGLRRELEAINAGLKDSVEKAQAAQQRQFTTYVEASDRQFSTYKEASDRKAEVVSQRLAALERGEAAGESRRSTVSELKASTVGWIAAGATIILAFVSLAANHII